MCILMSLYNIWIEKILNNEKPLEFRNNIGKNFKKGEKIYLYETSKNKGRKMVVGEVLIKDIQEIKFSKIGSYGLIKYYAQNILKDKKVVESIEEIYKFDLPNYDPSYKLYYLFQPDVLQLIKDTDKLPELMKMSTEEYREYDNLQKKAISIIKGCDKWLNNIGYYNQYGETFYKNYIELEKPIRYKTPIPLSKFKNLNGDTIKRAPQSWCYVQDL